MGLEDRFVIGSVGAHTPRKRFDLIIKTFAEIQRARREATLIIKTDRIRSLEGTDLQELAQREGVFDKTIFITEELSAGRMCALYNVMDIFLNLSEWEEFCIPAIEAMSCGIPVSSMPVQGPGETVPYEELRIPPRGIVDETGSMLLECEPEEAAEIIVDVSRNRSLVRELSRTGRREATSKFDIRRVAALWEELIGGHAN
jgi:glycosyltransferase involved in cell wall biosynthesis